MERLVLPVLLSTALLVGCPEARTSPGNDDDTPTPAPTDISDSIESIRSEAELPALGGARTEGGFLTHIGASGLRRLGSSAEVELDDRWHLGSNTKAMTAALFATFVEEGELDWDSTVGQLFPNMEGIHEDFAAATARNFLMHRGGAWTSFANHPATWTAMWASDPDLPALRLSAAQDVLQGPPDFLPGAGFGYSNAGYIIIGAAMEQQSGQSWETLMEERVFQPLGMTDCGFGLADPNNELLHPQGHSGTTPSNIDNPPSFGPAGTLNQLEPLKT